MKVPSWYQNHKQVQHFPKAKRKKVLLQIFSAPTYFTLLIDANHKSVIIFLELCV